MMILEKLLAALSMVLLVVCMLAPLRKLPFADRHPWVKKALRFHTLYGWLLLAAALAHGILAGKQPGMITGKLAWMALLLLLVLTLLRKRMKTSAWVLLHRVCSVAVCVLVLFHIIVRI